MQVINSPPNSHVTNISDFWQAHLKDIVENITIQSNFCITHPQYKSFELNAKSVERFEKLPPSLQQKYLSIQLCAFLSGIYFTQSIGNTLANDQEIANSAESKITKNTTTSWGIDILFFDRLHDRNHGQGNDDPGWRVLRQKKNDTLVVSKNELTLHIKRQKHLHPQTQTAAVGELVSIRLPRSRVDSRNYIAIANAGSQERDNLDSKQQSVCIYMNFGAEGAVIFMDGLTKQLNELGIPFSFKVPYNPWDYNRCDSGKLYFSKRDYKAVKSVIKSIYWKTKAYFNSECPFLTKILAPGIALAEEPDLKISEEESFSKNRCQIIANGLLEAWQKGKDSPDSRMATIINHFDQNGIDLRQPYLNRKSNDIYSLLDT